MDEKKKFDVSVLGETIRINSDEDIDYMNEVFDHINNLVDKIVEADRTGMSTASKLLFAIVLLTDELFKTREKEQNLIEKLKLSDLELAKVQREMADFISMFEGEAGTPNV